MSRIIAVCGVDGCGKSSLISAYAERMGDPKLKTFHKKDNRCVQFTQRYHARTDTPKADWLSGPFALSIGAGAMFDFLDHYQTQIEPYIDQDGTLLCDRYTFCFLAYLYGTGHEGLFDQLFAHVRPPDQVIHVDVDFELLAGRYAQREEKNEDEFVELMVAFREGYQQVYDHFGVTPTYITNNSDFESAYTQFAAAFRGGSAPCTPG